MNFHTAQFLHFLCFLQVGLCSGFNCLQNAQKDLQKCHNLLDWTGCEYAVVRVANVKPTLFQTELKNGEHFLISKLFRGDPNQKNKKLPWKKHKQIKTTIFSDFLDWGGGLGKSPKFIVFVYVFCFSNVLLFSAFWVYFSFSKEVFFLFSGGGPVCDFFLSR